jgi:hypothetical protein
MSETTFRLVLDGLRTFRTVPLVFFGGFGEPLIHPDIFRMIGEVKRPGTAVELITNGTLLDEALVPALLESELDTLWVSVDGTADCGHAGAGAAGELGGLLSKVRRLQPKKLEQNRKLPHHTRKYSVSNLLPHTEPLKERILFRRSLYNLNCGAEVDLPRLDYDEATLGLLQAIWQDPAYTALRSRLLDFDFSPCSWCNCFDFPDANREDCFGSPTPTCRACLWAQGFVRCP